MDASGGSGSVSHKSGDTGRRIRYAVAAFVVSRLIVFAVLIVGAQIAFLQKVYSGSVWETRIDLDWERVRPTLIQQVLIGDAWWYRSIAEDGYASSDHWPADRKAAFFPLYPLTVRLFSATGEFALDGILVSNLTFLGALVLLSLLSRSYGHTDEVTSRIVFYVAFFPTSYFFSLPLTESLFLLTSVAAFLAASRERWLIAGFVGGLAALTRATGILLFPVLLILAWQRARRLTVDMLWLLLIPSAMAGFAFFHELTSGDGLRFITAQESWGRTPGAFWKPLLAYAARPDLVGEAWNLVTFNFAVAVLMLVCSTLLLRRREWALGTYTLLAVLMPLSSGSLQSMGRYALVVFPVFFWLGAHARSGLVDRCLTVVAASAFGLFLILFSLRVDFALA